VADNVPITPGAGKDIATDDVGAVHYQKIKVDLGGDGVSSPLVRGQQTMANSIPVTVASDQTGQKVRLWDGTSDATVRNLASNDALNVAIVDGSGAQVTSFAGSGGTSSTDDADFTAGSTAGTPIIGVFESSPTTVTDGDMGIIGIDTSRRVKVSVDASALDVNHDAVDSGAPVKIGMQARTSFPTAVANADRVNATADVLGRQQVTHISGEQFIWKQVEATTAQTGTTIWDPTSGKRIAVTGYEIGTGGVTGALVTLWFGANADVTFSQGTDQVLFRGTLIPSSTSAPGVISNFASPVFCTTADHELHYTTSAGITIYITVYGYEW
jgi:hypothetical protein